MMPLLSLAHLTLIDADPLALIEAAAAGGFDAIGLRIVAPFASDSIVPVIGDMPLQRRIKARLAATGLRILDVEAFWLHPQTDIDTLKPALDLAADLGARYLLTVGNDPGPSRMTANYARLCEAAQARGLRTMLEFIPYSCVQSLEAAHRLLTAAAPADAGLLVDALHLCRSGGSPSDVALYEPGLFSYVQICDAPRASPPPELLRSEARGGRLYPGEGELWLADFIAAFAPGTPVALEAPAPKYAALPLPERGRIAGAASRQTLQKIYAALNWPSS
ncbi:MAG: sugar phosphate isomerase/epimerase [Hyphomicrobiales bacterium]|nr:sugar phosphate isomerase/epimerase [Hyphomicrobiales bacterium]